LIADCKTNLKLRSRDVNGNTLFGVSRRSLHPVGVLHINSYVDNSIMSCSSRGSSASSQSCTEEKCRHSTKNSDDDELTGGFVPASNVMMASG
uniref:Pecanex-like protein n=1 Tax=Gongylonema pulchrum TaxID=637853 RepID=A0A183D7D3_9BILA